MAIKLEDIAIHFIGNMDGFDSELDRTEGRAQSWASRVGGFLSNAFSVATGTLIAQGINAIGGAMVKATADAEESARVQGQLNAVLTSTQGIAGQTVDSVNAYAQSIEDNTRITKEAAIAGQSMLLTFTNIGGETFPRATQSLLDMATAMSGGATPSAEQLAQQAIQLGKALNDPVAGVSALSRVGVTFTDATKEQIKALVEAGDVAAAQAIILRELETEFGGSAAAAEEANGAFEAARDVFDDFGQTIIENVRPALNDLFETFTSSGAPAALQELAGIIGGALASALNWLTNVGIPGLISGWNQIAPAVNAALDVLSSIGDVLGAVASYAYTWGSDLVAEYANGIAGGIGWVVDALQSIGDTVSSWLQPNSPPRILPEIDKWGLDAARLYMQGWSDPSLFESVRDFGATLGTLLENINGGESSAGVASALFGSRAAYADALNELQATGQVSAQTFARIGAEAGDASDEVLKLAGEYLALESATLKANAAQQTLVATNGEVEAAETALLNAIRDGGDLSGAKGILAGAQARRDSAEAARAQAAEEQRQAQQKIDREQQLMNFQRDQLNLLQQIATAQDKAAKAATSKKPKESEEEKAARQAREAQDAYNFSLLDTAGKIDTLKNKQATLNPGQKEYWELASQIKSLEAQAAREAETNAKKEQQAAEKTKKEQEALADAQWQHAYAIADTAGKLQMMKDKLATLNPDQTEYYQTLTNIARLEDQLEKEREAREKKAAGGAKAKGAKGGGGIKPIDYRKPAGPARPSAGAAGKADEAGGLGAFDDDDPIGIAGIFGNIGATVQRLISEGLPGIVSSLGSWVKAFSDWIIEALPGMGDRLGEYLAGLSEEVFKKEPEVTKMLAGWTTAFSEWVVLSIPGLIGALGQFAGNLFYWGETQRPNLQAMFVRWAFEAYTWITDKVIPGSYIALNELNTFLFGWLADRVPLFQSAFLLWIAEFLNWIDGGTGVLFALPTELAKIWTELDTWFTATVKEIDTSLLTWVNAFLNWIAGGDGEDVVGKLPGELAKVVSAIVSWISTAGPSLGRSVQSIGTAMVNGIQTGIQNAWGAFMAWIERKIGEIPEPIRDVLGIDSPSKVMADTVGRPIVQGIQAGMDAEMPGLLQSAAGMIGGISGIGVPALAGGGNGLLAGLGGLTVNGPLIGNATIRNERDIDLLAQAVARKIRDHNG